MDTTQPTPNIASAEIGGETLRERINDYYKFRSYKDPNQIDAMLWLIAEMGELAEAVAFSMPDADWARLRNEKSIALYEMISLGRRADEIVGADAGWVRNGDRKRKLPDVGDEVGDVLMMLDRVARMSAQPDVVECLRRKMAAKGFEK